MVSIKRNLTINSPIDQVFSYITELEKVPLWAGPVSDAKWTSEGPIGVGSTNTKSQQLLGRKMVSEYVVVDYEKDRKFSEKTTSGPLEIVSTILLEAVDGGTNVSVEANIEAGGIFKIAESVLANVVKRQVNADFETLKDLLESNT
jgi:uncharacterized membrane protein